MKKYNSIIDYLEELYLKARSILNIKLEDFLDMTINETEKLIKEKNKYDNQLMLNLASYNASMIMNENSNDNFNKLNELINDNKYENYLKKRVEKYKIISERLGLKFPK